MMTMIEHGERGFGMIIHFVKVQNAFMAKNRQLPQHNMPEMWDANLGGMHGLTEDDWLDLLLGWITYRDQFNPSYDMNMMSAARDLEDMLCNDLAAFMRDLSTKRSHRSSRYKTAAWRFMMCVRETINNNENYDPMLPPKMFNKLFDQP